MYQVRTPLTLCDVGICFEKHGPTTRKQKPAAELFAVPVHSSAATSSYGMGLPTSSMVGPMVPSQAILHRCASC
jgi:hypothetical protein